MDQAEVNVKENTLVFNCIMISIFLDMFNEQAVVNLSCIKDNLGKMGIISILVFCNWYFLQIKWNLSSVFNNVEHAYFNASVLAAKFKF